eukprot:SAG31_NODE_763_length_12265_cov_3.024984_17_plen_180_part_00
MYHSSTIYKQLYDHPVDRPPLEVPLTSGDTFELPADSADSAANMVATCRWTPVPLGMLMLILVFTPICSNRHPGASYKRRDQMSPSERQQAQDEIAEQIADDVKCQLCNMLANDLLSMNSSTDLQWTVAAAGSMQNACSIKPKPFSSDYLVTPCSKASSVSECIGKPKNAHALLNTNDC